MTRLAWNVCAAVCVFLVAAGAHAQSRPTRIAIVGFTGEQTSADAGGAIKSIFGSTERDRAPDFEVIDRDLAATAARGAGYAGKLNLSVQEARDLGSVIGADFYFLGDAQTVRRTSTSRPIYFETYASIFLVSARTGRLILWDGPAAEADSAAQSEAEFKKILSSRRDNYLLAVRRALEDERVARATAVAGGTRVIELLVEETTNNDEQSRPPRPFRRIKPPYPDAAARLEIEATVDVLVDIDAKGEVGRVEVERWAGYGLDESVVTTVKQLHFFPAMREGVAIPMRVVLRYNFRKPPK